MPTVLVLYASHYGQTRSIAERIGDRFRARGYDVGLVDVRDAGDHPPPPQDYDLVVLGSRVELGRHATAIRNYIAQHVDGLREIPTGFFSVSMAASKPSPDPSGYLNALFSELGWNPTRAVAFAGALPYRKYGWLMRLIMKRISRSAGHATDTSKNHVLTDWDRVDAFADELLALLPAVMPDAVRPDRATAAPS